MIQRVIEVGKKVGTPTGIHTMDTGTCLKRIEQGMQFLGMASELKMMTEKAQEAVKQLWPDRETRDVARY